MIISTTTHNRFAPAAWLNAQARLLVAGIDPRCLTLDDTRQWYESPEQYLRQPTTIDPHTHQLTLQPYYDFRIRLNIGVTLTGRLYIDDQHGIGVFTRVVHRALNSPYSRDQRTCWEADRARLTVELNGDDVAAAHWLEQSRAAFRTSMGPYNQVKVLIETPRRLETSTIRTSLSHPDEILTALLAIGTHLITDDPEPIASLSPALQQYATTLRLAHTQPVSSIHTS